MLPGAPCLPQRGWGEPGTSGAPGPIPTGSSELQAVVFLLCGLSKQESICPSAARACLLPGSLLFFFFLFFFPLSLLPGEISKGGGGVPQLANVTS